MQEQLVIPFFCPEIEKAGNRRRTRTVASSDAAITSRRDRLEKRNRIMTARYYYWTEIKRRRTISNTLVEQDDFYNELLRSKASTRKLKAMFPGFDWN